MMFDIKITIKKSITYISKNFIKKFITKLNEKKKNNFDR